MSTTMTYGSYTFSPVPIVEINKEIVRTGDATPIQEVTTVVLNGTLVASANLATTGGITLVKAAMDSLRDAFKNDCELFVIECNGTDLVRARPRVSKPPQFTPTNNNWVLTAEYTIELEFSVEIGESSNYADNIRQASDSWSLEFMEENNQYTETIDTGQDHLPYVMRLTHSVSAEGIRECIQTSGTGAGAFASAGWEHARNWVNPRLGYDSGQVSSGASGSININVGSLGLYNHMRTQNLNEVGGTFEVTETWVVVNTGVSGTAAAGAIEDFTVSITSSRSQPTSSVRIEGTIQGLEVRDYGSSPGDFTITTEKYSNALTYWNNVQGRLYARCKAVTDPLSWSRNIHVTPLSTNIGHAKRKGVINYSYEFDNRVCFLLETGSLSGSILSEIITMNDTYPNDVFATIPILGRANGPILQEMSTITENKRDVSIEVLVEPPTGCSITSWNTLRDSVKSGVNDILCELQTELTDSYSQVFKHQDTQSWVPQQGRYTRQIGWTFANCSGTGNTSVCS